MQHSFVQGAQMDSLIFRPFISYIVKIGGVGTIYEEKGVYPFTPKLVKEILKVVLNNVKT